MSIGIVETKYGKLHGVELEGKYEGITLFKGIPYAAPPVGKLRWAPPEDPKSWEDIRVCDKYGPAAPQVFLDDIHADEYYFMGNPEISEDCLYINICTGAAKAGEKRPVFMWFHGGGLRYCYSYEAEFDPSELARKGIIVITVGQRLNIFGYMSLPQLTAEQGKSGNYGLMDQIKALDWVYENIEAFGGDPENITVGGQSGGSWKACTMAAIPASRGRVKRVISHSGLKWMQRFPTMADAERQGRQYLKYMGLDPDLSLDELRALHMDTFVKDPPRVIAPGDMVYDGELIPFPTLRESFDKYLDGVDFLNCTNFGEADMFAESESGLNYVPIRSYLKKIDTAADFYAHFKNLLGDLYDKYDFDNLVKVTDDTAHRTARRLATLGLSGREGMNFSRNLMLNRMFGKYMKKRYAESKVYSFLWSHILPARPEDYGTYRDPARLLAFHSSEMWFSFASLREGIPPIRQWRDIDFKLADIVSSYWANFIRTGNPNGEGLPEWPASGDDFGYIDLDIEIKGYKGADSKLDRLLQEFVSAEYKLQL